MPAAIENVPNVVKSDMKELPAASASAIASYFAVTTSSAAQRLVGRRVSATLFESPTPVVSLAEVQNEHVLDAALLGQQSLCPVEGHEQRRIGCAGAIEVDDLAHSSH